MSARITHGKQRPRETESRSVQWFMICICIFPSLICLRDHLTAKTARLDSLLLSHSAFITMFSVRLGSIVFVSMLFLVLWQFFNLFISVFINCTDDELMRNYVSFSSVDGSTKWNDNNTYWRLIFLKTGKEMSLKYITTGEKTLKKSCHLQWLLLCRPLTINNKDQTYRNRLSVWTWSCWP